MRWRSSWFIPSACSKTHKFFSFSCGSPQANLSSLRHRVQTNAGEMKAVVGLRRKLGWSGSYACPGAHSMICQGPAKDLCSFEHVHQSIAKANESIQKTVCIGAKLIQTACMLWDACKVSAEAYRETRAAAGT